MARNDLPPGVTRTDDGRWRVRIRVGKDLRTGRWKWTNKLFGTRREAVEFLGSTKRAVSEGRYALPTGDTVDQVATAWLGSLHRSRPTTLRNATYDIAPLRQVYGNLPIQQLTRVHLDALLRDLKAGGVIPTPKSDPAKPRYRRPNAPRSLNKTIEATENLLDYAMNRKLVRSNCARDVQRFEKAAPAIQALTADQTQTVLAQADQERDAVLYYLALSGFRREDLAGLRWSDIDLGAATVRVANARVQNGSDVVENAPKTASGVRTLPLDDGLARVLRRAKVHQSEERLAAAGAYQGGEYVLSDELGRPYRPEHIYRRWRRCLRLAKVPPVRLHDARHSCATAMAARGVPLAGISAWLGHSDPSVTARLYLHADADALRDAAKALGEINRPTSKSETGTE